VNSNLKSFIALLTEKKKSDDEAKAKAETIRKYEDEKQKSRNPDQWFRDKIKSSLFGGIYNE
jgi:hypothetical protein